MSHIWRAGMEAVFVGWPKECRLDPADTMVVNRIYIVEDVYLAPPLTPFRRLDGSTGLTKKRLIYLKICGNFALSDAFRPVQKRATDISIFHELRRGVERVVKEKA